MIFIYLNRFTFPPTEKTKFLRNEHNKLGKLIKSIFIVLIWILFINSHIDDKYHFFRQNFRVKSAKKEIPKAINTLSQKWPAKYSDLWQNLNLRASFILNKEIGDNSQYYFKFQHAKRLSSTVPKSCALSYDCLNDVLLTRNVSVVHSLSRLRQFTTQTQLKCLYM